MRRRRSEPVVMTGAPLCREARRPAVGSARLPVAGWVHLHDQDGVPFSLPAAWTDVAAVDPFVVIAEGRCPFTTTGLLGLADLVDGLRDRPAGVEAVKRNTP